MTIIFTGLFSSSVRRGSRYRLGFLAPRFERETIVVSMKRYRALCVSVVIIVGLLYWSNKIIIIIMERVYHPLVYNDNKYKERVT